MYYIYTDCFCTKRREFNTLEDAIEPAKKAESFIFHTQNKTFVFDVRTMRKFGD
jgi:hypothetical protein